MVTGPPEEATELGQQAADRLLNGGAGPLILASKGGNFSS
jgi:hypothetical protein